MRSKGEWDKRRRCLVERFADKQQIRGEIVKMTGINEEIKKELLLEMGKELRNSSKVRIRNRCIINGNGRGIVRKYRMSRHELKKWVCLGRLPLKRASW